jgi:hypothetical protein
MPNPEVTNLKLMVRGAYDLQKLRIQCGLRLCANFAAKLEKHEDLEDEDTEELTEKAESLLKLLKASYARLTDGIARNRTLPAEAGFIGDERISNFSELVLVHQYVNTEKLEVQQFAQMLFTLNKIPIYTEYLAQERGIGPAMAGVLITYLDPHKAERPSQFWKYAGIDVAKDGAGRSRREEHLVDVNYLDKEGKEKTKKGLTYNPFLKTKLTKVLAMSFMRVSDPPSRWRDVYYGYKHRLESDPARTKITVTEWKKKFKAGEEMRQYWPPGRIHNASSRYMVKMFLAEYWNAWRRLEGLPIVPTYHEAVLGHVHHDRAAE